MITAGNVITPTAQNLANLEADMRALTPALVGPLYKRKYWDKVAGDLLPSGLDYAVFDAAINSGPGRAAKWLQELVGVTADGAIGPGTLAAAPNWRWRLCTQVAKV